jgi:hypothetical protein
MTPKLTELIDRASTLSPQERLDLLTYLQSTPERADLGDLSQDEVISRNIKFIAELRERSNKNELEGSETNTDRSIASKYAGSLEFTDAEFAAMLKELEEDK